jgi:hypothetical protein
VRDAVRTVWTAPALVDEINCGRPEQHPDGWMTVLAR